MPSIVEQLRRFWSRLPIVHQTPRTLWEQVLVGCPDCKQSPMQLFEGPSGGLSTNVFCSNCGHGYNITPVLQQADDIGVNLAYCQNEQIKARRVLEERYARTS